MWRRILWAPVAWLASRPAVTDWLVRRAKRTPYSPIISRDGSTLYMDRWWLFNPYPAPGQYRRKGWRDWLPSIRVHHIVRPDDDGAMHDHPWNARTIVLRGWYEEERPASGDDYGDAMGAHYDEWRHIHLRKTGYTGRVLFNSYHRISEVSPGGVYTLWFTWRYRGTWGFLVNGRKVPWREHLG